MDKVKRLTIQLDQMRENVDIAYDVGEGRTKQLYGHKENCDCAVCDDIAYRRELNISGLDAAIARHDEEILVLKAELITERLLSDKIRCDEKTALSKAEFWRMSHDAACEDAKNWRRDAQELQGVIDDILSELQSRGIHLLSKHCWCGPAVCQRK